MAILGMFGKKPAPRPKSHKPEKKHPKPVKRPAPKPVRKVVVKRPQPKPVAKAPQMPKLPPVIKVADSKAYEMLKDTKVPMAPFVFVKRDKDLADAIKKIKFPIVMKVGGPMIHKTELGGVVKDINSDAAAMDAFNKLMSIKGAEAVIVQKQLSGLELIVGGKSDPQFGYIVSVGIGGIYVEILKDVTFRVAPITAADAAAMVRELKGYEILAGARGAAPIKFEALYDVLIKVSKLIGTAKLKELDINPLFCTPDGCWAADVRAIKQ